MREEYSQHIHHTTNEVQKAGVLVPVCAQAHKQQAQQQKEPGGQMRGPLLMCIWARRVPA